MKLHKFTLTPPIVAISAALFCGALFGGPKTWNGGESGDWNDPENWDPVGLPSSDDDVMVAGADVTLTGPVDVKSLTVSGASKLTVKAIGLQGDDLKVFETLETDLAPIAAKLWEMATIVNVRYDFRVVDGATVYPEADKVSGVPVIFKVGGNFNLGEESSFNAVNRGWGWTLGSTDLAGAKTNPGGTAAWTFAPGPGHAYQYGGGYGGNASCPNMQGSVHYGYAYGCSFAPFLPGSCSGLYTQTSEATVDGTRGGGAIVIFTEGTATIDGTMTAMSERHDYSSASGGSIWLTASSFTFDANARFTAKAADSLNYQWQGVGGGGRIALAEGYTWADIKTAASGTVPTGFIEQPTIWPEIVPADVSKAACNHTTKSYEPNPGTLSFVRKADQPVQMRVTIDGAGSVTYDGVTHDESFEIDVPVNSPLTLTASAADGNVFSAWYGDGLAEDGVAETELSHTSSLPFKLRVVFKSLAATPRAWTGAVSDDWNTGANWDPVGVPGPNDAVTVSGATLGLSAMTEIAALTLTGGASFSVGGADVRNAGTLNVSGDLTVEGGSKLTVYANTLSDYSAFANKDFATITNAIWQAAKFITVGGDFTVTGSGTVVSPDVDPVTGVPVIFKVGGDFALGEGAKFDAAERGWGWVESKETGPAGSLANGFASQPAWTFAIGPGYAHYAGGGYGGAAASTPAGGYGQAYGSAIAPFLPGSCGSHYTQLGLNVSLSRGGGVVAVFAEGTATVDGTINVSSIYRDHAGAAGGAIWLAAESFSFGATAELLAKGGNVIGYSGTGAGGGGRISLAEGYTWDDFQTAAGGAVPDGFRLEAAFPASLVKTDVSGGDFTGGTPSVPSHPGTLALIRSTAQPVDLTVTIVGEGSVNYGGVTYDKTFTVSVPTAQDLALVATPAEGARFISWGGACISGLFSEEPELHVTLDAISSISVTFARGDFVREWFGGASGAWESPVNWQPAGLPKADEPVVISNATVSALESVTVSNLTLKGGASLSVGGADERTAGTLNIAGDLTVEGGSTLTVYANEVSDYSVFATLETDITPITNALWNAAKIVTVGGNLTVKGEGSAVYPDAGKVTGVPVIFKVGGDFTLGEGAKFDAAERGWGWTRGDAPIAAAKVNGGGGPTAWNLAPGAGFGYTRGGGYGGNAAVVDTQGGHKHGYAYGSAVAPFLPGSCGGFYQQNSQSAEPTTRGGGAIVVFAAGKATVDGSMNVSSIYRDHAGASGGAIYLAAQEFAFGANAALTAKGGNTVSYSGTGMGGGGRIALAEGYTWDDFVTAAGGVVPEGFRAEVEFPSGLVTTDVSGGDFTAGTTPTPAQPGTLAYICSMSQPVELTVTIVGDGRVSFDGETYDKTFMVTVPTAQDLTFTAETGEGSRFISWGGTCIPGMFSEEPELHLTLDAISSVVVTFADGDFARVWCGGATGAWELPVNWQPAGLPKEEDNVIISNATVSTSGPVTAGSLTLAGSTVLENAAVPLEEPYERADIFNRPTVITVNGALRVEDTAKIVPVNDPKTGAAVRYDVGSLYVAEGASIDANGTGWYWYESKDDPYATVTQDKYQTRAPGAGGADKPGEAYSRGGGYGGEGGNSKDQYGHAYGFKYAPYLPGSPNGVHSWAIGNSGHPGGTIWIRCAGLAEINGTLSADGLLTYFGAPSGGAVWLAAKGLAAGMNAKISAQGGELTGSYTSYGAGGRVSVALGLTDAQFETLYSDEPVDGLAYEDEVTAIAVDVRSGVRHAPEGDLYGNSGTATTVTGPLAYQRVTVASSGKQAKGVAPTYGNYSYEGGTVQTFTAPEYGVDPDDPSVRYLCTGWELVNAAGERTSGDGRTAEVTVENGPLTLTWTWGAAQSRTVIRKPAHGSLTFDGVAVDGDGIIWATGLSPEIAVVPDEGYEFVGWEGNAPYGKTWANPLQVTVTEPLDVTPVLRAVAEPMTRTWNGTGAWTDAANWEPAGLPGAGDTVVIAGGTCVASNGLRAAALTVADGATLTIAAAGAPNGVLDIAGDVSVAGTLTVGHGAAVTGGGDSFKIEGARMPGHVHVAVGGDFALTGNGRVEVYGGPVGGDFTFARGCGFIDVGGTLALADTSVLALYSDIYTGGSVKITAGGFTVAEGATVDAASKGYAWANSSTPPDAPGLGYSYTIAASHGGWGCQPSGQNTNKTRAPYDFELAPIKPGSANGTYSGGQRPGGGVIRVHAKTASVDGTLDAGVVHSSNYGGAAGGSIWLTADTFAFGANAKLIANGGKSKAQYATYGAGGRIALGYKLSDERIVALAETGTWTSFRAKRQKTLEEFRAAFSNETMTVNVEMGGIQDVTTASDAERATYERILEEGYPRGTFTYVDGTTHGLILLVR